MGPVRARDTDFGVGGEVVTFFFFFFLQDDFKETRLKRRNKIQDSEPVVGLGCLLVNKSVVDRVQNVSDGSEEKIFCVPEGKPLTEGSTSLTFLFMYSLSFS